MDSKIDIWPQVFKEIIIVSLQKENSMKNQTDMFP